MFAIEGASVIVVSKNLLKICLTSIGVLMMPLIGAGLVAEDDVTSPSTLRQPNIVFIFSDDHALQAIGAYGSQINQTPRIDQIARQGMVFDRSFCGNSICGPSRATVLTGKHSHLNGFMRNGDRFYGGQVTFPKLLQSAGYQTAVIGKWHLETNPTGFDHWEILPDQGHYYNPDFIQMDGSRKRFAGYCTDLIGDKSLEWLKNRDPNKPFLLMSQHKAPHRNWSPHPRHFGKHPLGSILPPETLFDDLANRSEMLKESEMSIAEHFYWGHDAKFHGENEFPDHFMSGINNGEYARMTESEKATWDAYYGPENDAFLQKLRAGELTKEQITVWKHGRYMHDYLGCIAAVDENVGRVLDYLDENGLTENTIVVYASDQGFYLGEHGWYDKRWMFEESLGMPFLIRWPEVVKAGTRSEAMIQNIDYAPTFLEAAGITPPAEMQGTSIMPILQSEGTPPNDWRREIYYAFYESEGAHRVPQHDGIRSERYKAIYFPKSDEWNLFDLETDPQEMTSRHDDPDHQTILADLQQRYHALRKKYNVNSAVIPESRWQEKWWQDRFEAKLKQAREEAADLVFIGDSITQGWEGGGREVFEEVFGSVKTMNLGFSGDRTEHVLWRLKRNSLADQKPTAAVIMIGTNNTGHIMQAPTEVADGVREIVDTLRSVTPDTKILLLGVFPRGEQPSDQGRQNNVAINELISKFADGEQVVFLDLADSFINPDGTISREIMPDFLHLTAAGYRLWADGLRSQLQAWNVLK